MTTTTRTYASNAQYSGKDNYGKPKSEYIERIAAMDHDALFEETKQKIWLSAYAGNNPRSDYHWHVDVVYDEWTHRGDTDQYSKAYKAVERQIRG